MGLEKQLAGFNEQLLDGEVGFKALFKSSPDPTWIINEKNLFVLCNLAAATVLGYDSVEALQAVHPSELSPEFQPDGQSSREKADAMMLPPTAKVSIVLNGNIAAAMVSVFRWKSPCPF